MNSSAEDRLDLIQKAYEAASRRREADVMAAQTVEERDRILANCDALELAFLKARRQSLEATGPAVEAAYQAARDATDAVETAYRQGKGIADKIRSVSGALQAITSLVGKAGGQA